MVDLRDEDRAALAARGIDPSEIMRQVALLREPPPPAKLVRAATPGDGIRQLTDDERAPLLARHEEAATQGRLTKLVPASGAASRMFQAAAAVRANEGKAADHAAIANMRARFEEFAFQPAAVAHGIDDSNEQAWLDGLLAETGLDLARRPKGLIPFHRYPGQTPPSRSAFVEHLIEGAAYVRDAAGRCRSHFTVATAHEDAFRRELTHARAAFETPLGLTFETGFSHQSPATDTVALDGVTHELFRQDDGQLLFRPGGHGALLANLDALGGDIVLIKNIDNVVPEDRQPLVATWQRLMTGLLVDVQRQVFIHAKRLEATPANDDAIEHACAFLVSSLNVPATAVPARPDPRRAFLADRLSRPIRVCAMVRNTGEPGGGPFWVEDGDGAVGLQIVEGAQIDRDDPAQAAILESATHFNPVALVCGLRDHVGHPFELARYVDPRCAFVADKSHDGRRLRALEHPGLWNGAMARWNTVFVEVPAATFAPVKTVLDLLRPEHQPPVTP